MLHCVPTGFAPTATYFNAEITRVTRWLDEEGHGLEAMVRLFKEHSDSLQDFDDNLYRTGGNTSTDYLALIMRSRKPWTVCMFRP